MKRKILHFLKEKSPKPYSKGKISNEPIFNKNFQIPSKDQDFLIFPQKKKINQNFQFLQKIQDFQNFSKKQKKFKIPKKNIH